MWDWLLGKRIDDRFIRDGELRLRPMVFEADTVRESAALLQSRFGHVDLYRIHEGDRDDRESVDVDSFTQLPDWQLRQLQLVGRSSSGQNVTVNLRGHTIPTINFTVPEGGGQPEQETKRAAIDVAEKLTREGRSRIPRSLVGPFVFGLIAVALVGAWVWTWIAERPGPSLVVLGWIGVATVISVMRERYRKLWRQRRHPHTGHRIRPISREDHRLRRLDAKRDLWVGLGGFAGGVVLTLIGTILTQQ